MAKTKKIIFGTIAAVLVLLTAFTTMAFALTGDGNTYVSGGGGHAVSGGYNVKDTTTDAVMGYRFTWLKGAGGGFRQKYSIDVYYNGKRPIDSSNGYPYHLKATINGTAYRNLDKYTYKNNYDNLSISAESSNTYYTYYQESDISGLSLPTVKNMPTWGKKDANMTKILGKMQSGATVDNLSYTDYVLIEPIFAVKINNVNYSITITEIGLLGCNIIGEDSIGNVGNYNGGNWATIYKYTNGAFASYLYTSDYDDHSDLGIANGSALSTSNRTTFKKLVDRGYGLMVCWNSSARGPIKVYYRRNGGTPSSTYTYSSYGTLKTKSTDTFVTQTLNYGEKLGSSGLYDVSTFGLTKSGYYADESWLATGSSGASKQFSDSYAYSYSDLRPYAVTNSSGGLEVYMEAQWYPCEGRIVYFANGGTIDTENYTISTSTKTVNGVTDKFIEIADSDKLANYRKLVLEVYGTAMYYSSYTYGEKVILANFGSDLTREGYTFAGWKCVNSGGTSGTFTAGKFYYPEAICSTAAKNAQIIYMQAVWTPKESTILFNLNYTGSAYTNRLALYDSKTAGGVTLKRTDDGYAITNGTGTATTDLYSVSFYQSANTALTFKARVISGSWGGKATMLAELSTGDKMDFSYKVDKTVTPSSYVSSIKIRYYSNGSSSCKFTDYKTSVELTNGKNTNYCPIGKMLKVGGTYGTLPTPEARAGYTFDGWYTAASGGTRVTSNTKFTGATTTVYAHWTPTYTVRYYLDGVEQTSLKQTCEYGESYTYPTVPASTVGNDSHKVLVGGWYEGNTADTKGTQHTAGGTFSNLTSTPGGEVKRYAYSYVKVIYRTNGGTVENTSYKDNGYGSIVYNNTAGGFVSQTLYYGQQLGEYGLWNGSSFDLTKTGYTFDGWLSEWDETKEFNETSVYGYHNFKNLVCDKYGLVYLKAKWVPNTYYISYVSTAWL